MLFVDLPKDRTDDEIVQIARSLQWRDWTRLRLLDLDSQEVRQEVAEMVRQLIQRADELTEVAAVAESRMDHDDGSGSPPIEAGEDEEPGLTDLIAEAEEALPSIAELIAQLGNSASEIGEAFSRATPKFREAQSFAERVAVSRQLAIEIENSVGRLYDGAKELDVQATRADPGIEALLDLVSRVGAKPENLDQTRKLLNSMVFASSSMKNLADSADRGRAPVQQMMTSSRDLRPILRLFLEGIDYLHAAAATVGRWGVRAAIEGVALGILEEE